MREKYALSEEERKGRPSRASQGGKEGEKECVKGYGGRKKRYYRSFNSYGSLRANLEGCLKGASKGKK